MRILVTGSSGLIGSKLVEILKKEHKVVCYDKKGPNKFPKGKFDIIFHCAAYCVIRDVINNPSQMFKNIHISYRIMELARKTGCKKLILFSSNRVSYPYKNPYTASKESMELMAEAYRACYGIDYIIIRPETVWGFNDNFVRVIPAWIKAALNNEPLVIYGNKDKELSPIYIDDFMGMLIEIFNNFDRYKNKKPITITGISLKAEFIANTIKTTANSKSEIIFKESEPTQPQVGLNSYNNITMFDNKFVFRIQETMNEFRRLLCKPGKRYSKK